MKLASFGIRFLFRLDRDRIDGVVISSWWKIIDRNMSDNWSNCLLSLAMSCWQASSVGDRHENGGWDPHLHFQLSWSDPGTHDMPGVVNPADREEALAKYPDPRMVMGPIY